MKTYNIPQPCNQYLLKLHHILTFIMIVNMWEQISACIKRTIKGVRGFEYKWCRKCSGIGLGALHNRIPVGSCMDIPVISQPKSLKPSKTVKQINPVPREGDSVTCISLSSPPERALAWILVQSTSISWFHSTRLLYFKGLFQKAGYGTDNLTFGLQNLR